MKKDIYERYAFLVKQSDTSERWIATAQHIDTEKEITVHGATAISAMVECMEKVAEVEGA
jgi:hypothetical protein